MGNDTNHPIITSLFPGSGGRARTVFRVADPQPGRHHCTVNHGGGCMLLLLASDGCTMSSESFSSVTLESIRHAIKGESFLCLSLDYSARRESWSLQLGKLHSEKSKWRLDKCSSFAIAAI